jgi:hypothetical protein
LELDSDDPAKDIPKATRNRWRTQAQENATGLSSRGVRSAGLVQSADCTRF